MESLNERAASNLSGRHVSDRCLCGAVELEIDFPAFWAWHDHSAAPSGATRLAGSILPAVARSLVKVSVKMTTSNAAPSSICFFTADDRPKVKTSLSPVAFSNCGPSSSRTAYTTVDA